VFFPKPSNEEQRRAEAHVKSVGICRVLEKLKFILSKNLDKTISLYYKHYEEAPD